MIEPIVFATDGCVRESAQRSVACVDAPFERIYTDALRREKLLLCDRSRNREHDEERKWPGGERDKIRMLRVERQETKRHVECEFNVIAVAPLAVHDEPCARMWGEPRRVAAVDESTC